MRIIVAPDSYKGSITAIGVARAMERGIRKVFAQARVTALPIADGGEGTVEALVGASGGRFAHTPVLGPLGAPVSARWGILGDGRTAVMEMAAASGLPLLKPEERDPLTATTFGTGQMLKAALDQGISRLILGIGGSATNDGGTGFAAALGVRFLDADGRDLPPGGGALGRLARIDANGLDPRLQRLKITVACDVDNPLCGPRGASAVFGPQKGATPPMAALLDDALRRYGQVAEAATGRRVADLPGAGAAGGLGAGLLFFTRAELKPGIDIVLETLNFDQLCADADLVITGEGRSDYQTAYGKAPVGVASIAKKRGVPVICLSGGLGEGYEHIYARGVDAAAAVPPGPMSLEECLAGGERLVEDACERLCRVLAAGMSLDRARTASREE
jgi:glycerate kinase